MFITNKLFKNKKRKSDRELDEILEKTIKKIALLKGNHNFDNFFIPMGEELIKHGINSAVCVFDIQKNNYIIKYLRLEPKFKKIFDANLVSNFDIQDFPRLKEALKNKTAAYDTKTFADIKKISNIPADNKIFKEQNVIIAPMLIQEDDLGFIAFSGAHLRPAHLPLFEAFTQRMVFLLTSKILFQEIKKTEKRYENLWEQAPIAYHTLDARGIIQNVNSMGCEVLGYKKEEMIGRPIFDFILPEQQADARRRFRMKVEGRDPGRRKERVYVRKDGAKIYVSTRDAFERNARGRIISVRTTILDYTKRHKMEKALEASVNQIRQSQKNLEQIMDTIQNGICVIDKNFKIINCNQVFRENTNLDMENILNCDCREIIPAYGQGALQNHCARGNCRKECVVAEVFKSGAALDYIEISKDKNGEKHYYKINIFPAKDSADKIYQAVMTIENITVQAKAQNEYQRLSEFNRKILDSAPISIVAVDKNGVVISANKLAHAMMDRPQMDAIGRRLCDTAEIKNNPELLRMYDGLLKKGEPFSYDNLEFISDKDKQGKFLNIIAVPLFKDDNTISGAISMAINNTEMMVAKQKLEELNRNLEQIVAARTRQLDAANKSLQEAVELKSKFIADASHELRTPLTVIQGNLDLAIREAQYNNTEAPETYDLILSEVARMTRVLSDLTMLTNSDAKTEKLNKTEIRLDKLIGAVGQSLKVLAEQKKIALIYKKNLKKIKVSADEEKLEKLLLNFVRNAIKYTDQKGAIKIWADCEGDFARVHVQDNGIGIPAEDLPYIFERFYRVDKARSRAEGGTGLGLSICRWIAEAHGGHINVISAPGQGSTFTVYLPLKLDSAESAQNIG